MIKTFYTINVNTYLYEIKFDVPEMVSMLDEYTKIGLTKVYIYLNGEELNSRYFHLHESELVENVGDSSWIHEDYLNQKYHHDGLASNLTKFIKSIMKDTFFHCININAKTINITINNELVNEHCEYFNYIYALLVHILFRSHNLKSFTLNGLDLNFNVNLTSIFIRYFQVINRSKSVNLNEFHLLGFNSDYRYNTSIFRYYFIFIELMSLNETLENITFFAVLNDDYVENIFFNFEKECSLKKINMYLRLSQYADIDFNNILFICCDAKNSLSKIIQNGINVNLISCGSHTNNSLVNSRNYIQDLITHYQNINKSFDSINNSLITVDSNLFCLANLLNAQTIPSGCSFTFH